MTNKAKSAKESEDDVVVLNPPNTGAPVKRVWMFISRDQDGKENVIGSVLGSLGTQPFVTGNPVILDLFLPMAREIERRIAGSGTTIHLITFSCRKELLGWQDGIEASHDQ